MSKQLIIFTDCGDTIVNEATQIRDERQIVTEADFIPGADVMLRTLYEEGYRIALVADGEVESFSNIFQKNGLGYCFEERIISEAVGEQKPAQSMFQTALEKMGLGDADKSRIVMIGNNLKKDIAGANRFGITSIWLDWSPRYFHTVEEPDWQPDYTVKTPEALKERIDWLERELEAKTECEKGGKTEKTEKTEKTGHKAEHRDETEASAAGKTGAEAEIDVADKTGLEAETEAADDIGGGTVTKAQIEEKCRTLLRAFPEILSEADEKFLQNMQTHNLGGDDLSRYRYWEWPQGVGLYGIWKDFLYHGTASSLELLTKYYDRQMEMGFPSLNVNTAAPYLAMSYLAEYTGNSRYMEACKAAVAEIMISFPRTEEGGFQHQTSDCVNEQELWDDTLFMLVLFVANMGRILKDETLSEEAERQFLLHAKYLSDPETGLWYHGWTFKERNHFAGAFWGRGNCWVTMGIPEFLAMGTCSEMGRKQLTLVLQRQVESLRHFQDEGGMWHTLIDDPDSYLEASATCGITYGILRAVKEELVNPSYLEVARKALPAILNCIMEDGVVSQVSYGTPMGRQSKAFYKTIPIKPMPYGQALALLALEECA